MVSKKITSMKNTSADPCCDWDIQIKDLKKHVSKIDASSYKTCIDSVLNLVGTTWLEMPSTKLKCIIKTDWQRCWKKILLHCSNKIVQSEEK